MSTHPQRMARAIEVAKAYRKSQKLVGGRIILWRMKAIGWKESIVQVDLLRPGTLLVSQNDRVEMATGGDMQNGARELSDVWDPPAAEKKQTTTVTLYCTCWMCLNTGPGGACEKCGLPPSPDRVNRTGEFAQTNEPKANFPLMGEYDQAQLILIAHQCTVHEWNMLRSNTDFLAATNVQHAARIAERILGKPISLVKKSKPK